ncbi:hypothetical protein CK203_030090 [Vitis vinifera]|uniref:Uncharacterized protein n=1 Tax=Vitis vinifera TaxID=29760 RepID=A0A438IK92_VITVI|nr:hypothetical protein CK203_030090 [Vitis vinifera]
MSSKKKAASSARVGDAHEKSTDKLERKGVPRSILHSKWRNCGILNGEDVVSIEKVEQDIVIFSKEHFNAAAPVPSVGVVQGIPPFTKIPTRPSFIPISSGCWMGCSIINMLLQPRPHAVGDLTKGGAKGHVMVQGAWAGSKHPGRPFSSELFLEIPGPEKRDHLVDWVEKASFACLSKLFEIGRQGEALQDAAQCAEPDGGRPVSRKSMLSTFSPGKCQRRVVPGEHYTVKDLPILPGV